MRESRCAAVNAADKHMKEKAAGGGRAAGELFVPVPGDVKGGSYSPFEDAIKHLKYPRRASRSPSTAENNASYWVMGQKVCGGQNQPLSKDKGAQGPRD